MDQNNASPHNYKLDVTQANNEYGRLLLFPRQYDDSQDNDLGPLATKRQSKSTPKLLNVAIRQNWHRLKHLPTMAE